MSNCAQCNQPLVPIHGQGMGLRFCGVKCCRAYHSPDIERRVRDDTPPYTAQKLQNQIIKGDLRRYEVQLDLNLKAR